MDISVTPESAGVYAQVFATLLIALAVERFEPLHDDMPRFMRIFDFLSRALRAIAVLATATAVATLLPVIGGADPIAFGVFWVHAAIYVSSLAIGSWAGVRMGLMFIDDRS